MRLDLTFKVFPQTHLRVATPSFAYNARPQSQRNIRYMIFFPFKINSNNNIINILFKINYYPPNIFINKGMKTCDGKITRVARLTPRFVPITTNNILNILFSHKSLKLSILPKF